MKELSHYIKLSGTAFITLIVLTACTNGPKAPGKYADTARCLTDKGVTMYGAYWCSHCAEQKQQFGDDVQFITYQECDDSGKGGDRKACLDAGVTSYPTWSFPGQGNLVGTNPIFVLAKLANCEDKLPAEDLQLLKDAQLAIDAAESGVQQPETAVPSPGETGQPEPVGPVVPVSTSPTNN